MMTYFESFLYGAVQGVTEYLPVSSSAHLILLPRFLGTKDPGLTFDVFLHFGTLLATLLYFWREWWGIVKPHSGFREAVSWKYIVLATIPALVMGGLFHHWIETLLRGNLWMCTTIAVGGLSLFAADYLSKNKRELDVMRHRDALWIGFIQCLALMPGFSRSGSTMMGARLLGFDRNSAARFSFLISAPVTLAAIVFEMRHWRELFLGDIPLDHLLIAGFSSFVFGCIAIGGLLRLLRRFGFLSFAVYRVTLAIVIFKVLGPS